MLGAELGNILLCGHHLIAPHFQRGHGCVELCMVELVMQVHALAGSEEGRKEGRKEMKQELLHRV